MAREGIDFRLQSWSAGPGDAKHRSLWADEALAADSGAEVIPFAGQSSTDVGIVGGGLSALWTAIRLKEAEPSRSVTILEADLVGTGASGRNSGAVGHYWSRLPVLLRYFGPADAARMAMAADRAIEDTKDFVAKHGLDAQIRVGPSVWSTNTPGLKGPWEAVFRVADKLGIQHPYRVLSNEDLRGYFGKGPYYAGVVDDTSVRVQPARLCRELRRVALAMGVAIHEKSPVTRIRSTASGVVAETSQGALSCGQLVLAANAWMVQLPIFNKLCMVLSSDIVSTAPIPEKLAALGMTGRPGGVNARQMLNYGGLTPEGRVYLGRGGGTQPWRNKITPALDYSPKQSREVEADFRFLYPELADVPIDRSWAGPIDRSATGLPRFGRLSADDRIVYAIGYTGHGIGATNICGYALSSMLLGKTDEWTDLAAIFARASNGIFPPEPIRYVAGKIVRASVLRKEVTERAGGKASRFDRELAKWSMATIPGRQKL